LALLASKSIKIKFASIDIVQDDNDNDNFIVLEINAGVMMEIFSKQNDKFYAITENIYIKAIEYMFNE
jgi:glutathione synthase/RimK-type ligase-like ATP-grasp enzyme